MGILITTIWKGSAVIQAIKLFAPDKVYFVVDDPMDAIRQNTIKMIKELFPNLAYNEISLKIYDLVGIAKSTIELIEKEKEEKITIHISEGRKTMSFGLLLGAYIQKEYINSVYYITEETNTPIQLPLLELKLSKQKRELLKKIQDNVDSVTELEKVLDIKAQTIYVYMKELRDEGFLNKENKITETGRIVLLKDQ